MLDLTTALLRKNDLHCAHYAEPFAGGCGLALGLLFSGVVADIHINDLDPAIWAFWHCVLNDTDRLVELVLSADVTLSSWHAQREVFKAPASSTSLELAFATFFLNRTNRSGVIAGGGVIGGLSQNGDYKIDCRYNHEDLARRIRRVARYRNQIHLTNLDALDFLKQELPARSFVFIDPPYFRKGPGLYTSYYKAPDHARLAKEVLRLRTPWIVTYDDVPEIRALYAARRQFSFDLYYSLNEKRIGTELLVASPKLNLPQDFRSHEIGNKSEAA